MRLVEARGGREVELAAMWAEGPALLLFWRHFGCSCGRDRAARLADEYAGYRRAGARVALIGQGEAERTLAYSAANELPGDMPLFCDPQDEYLRCEPDAGSSLFEARREAGRPMVDNPWLLPGEFVVDASGRIVTAHRYQFCEHWLDPRVHMAAIRQATGELLPAFAPR
jgi:peroxiredoxin